MSGIGIDEMINSGGTIATFEMNRWQQQVKDDGGEAKWSSKGSQIDFQPETEVNYE
jgi:hypothetical protein